MRGTNDFKKIYLHCDYVDFRKGINGLSVIVAEQMQLKAMDRENLFLFCNRSRNKMKILYWDKTGFALWLKDLEEDRFKWPIKSGVKKVEISCRELEWLLEGVDIQKIKSHKERNYKFAS